MPRIAALLPVLVAFVLAGCGQGNPVTAGPSGTAGPSASAGSGSLPAGSVAPAASASGSPAASATASGAAGTGPSASPTKPIASVKGTGYASSKSFKLKAGDYEVRWTLTSSSAAGCMAIGALRTPDGKVSVEVANSKVSGKGTLTGYEVVPNVKAGTYQVTFATTCAWAAQVFAQ